MFTRRELLVSTGAAAIAAATPAQASATEAVSAPVAAAPKLKVRQRICLDFDWRFHLGHAHDVARDFGFGANQRTYAKAGANVAGPAAADYDDASWAAVNLPHDWAIDLPFVPSKDLDPKLEEDPRAAHGFKPLGREYPETSVGWYRHVFELGAADTGRRISLEFDGVFRDALVIVNGYVVGRNESGYAPFRIDVTDVVNFAGKNVIAVRVDASLGEGWFYEGAGIYRHVWLVKTDPLHIPQWGTCIRPTLAGGTATVSVATDVANESDKARPCRVAVTILDPAGNEVAHATSKLVTLGAWTSETVTQAIVLADPKLWSIEAPHCYSAVTYLVSRGSTVDDAVTTFGLRSVRFDPEQGFFLNGKPVKLKGTCNHQDHAGVGAALPDRLHVHRIEKLKELGSNAYRAAHNPTAPEVLDACDRLGMVVIDETRMMSSDDEGLSQLTRLIRRDRNHPSIILWSIGNEEPHQGSERGARIARTMKRLANRLDPTRQVTYAMDQSFGEGVTPVADVIGFNYRTNKIEDFHQRFPRQALIGSETGSTVSTRGIYKRDDALGLLPAYDTEFPWWASTAEAWWSFCATRPYMAGGFVWTGFDYRGEPTPFNRWPNVSSQFGIMDTCGFAKDNYHYYKAWWSDAPLIHLLPHWNWQGQEGREIDVWCHTNAQEVELFLNGASLGVRRVERNRHAEWKVKYAPGVLEARGVGADGRMLVARRETTGDAARIVLLPDRSTIAADGADVSVLRTEIVDAQGRLVPTASNDVTFKLSGPGAVIGVGNGDPTSHEPDRATKRRAFNGLCLAVLQSARGRGGDIRVEATSPSLESGVAAVRTA